MNTSTPSTHNAVYTGDRTEDGSARVYCDGRPLDPRPSQRIWSHSPNGFEWGYGGSGPAQLALAILLHATFGDNEVSTRLHQDFKWEFVAMWNKRGWTTTRQAVLLWVASKVGNYGGGAS